MISEHMAMVCNRHIPTLRNDLLDTTLSAVREERQRDPGTSPLAAHYEYNPYGNLIHSNGPYKDANPIRFSTKWFDAETHLGYWGYRYYSPRLGRWISRDSIEEDGGLNLYSYCTNATTTQVDLNGLAPTAERGRGPSGPSPKVPSKSIQVRHKREAESHCGSFNIAWEFWLSHPAPEAGYLIQHVKASAYCEKQNEKRKCPISIFDTQWRLLRYGLADIEYWEAWPVEKGDRGPGRDTALWPVQRDTCGFAGQLGTVRFFRKSVTGDLATQGWVWGPVDTFKNCFNLIMTSGILFHTKTEPDFWNENKHDESFGEAHRGVVSSWDCCGIRNITQPWYFPH